MKIFGICPLCNCETEIKNQMANYQMCSNCGKIYGLFRDARVQGSEIKEDEKKELKEKAEGIIQGLIDSWRYI